MPVIQMRNVLLAEFISRCGIDFLISFIPLVLYSYLTGWIVCGNWYVTRVKRKRRRNHKTFHQSNISGDLCWSIYETNFIVSSLCLSWVLLELLSFRQSLHLRQTGDQDDQSDLISLFCGFSVYCFSRNQFSVSTRQATTIEEDARRHLFN